MLKNKFSTTIYIDKIIWETPICQEHDTSLLETERYVGTIHIGVESLNNEEAVFCHFYIHFRFFSVKDFVNVTRGLMITGTGMFGISLLLILKYASDQSAKCVANLCITTLVIGGKCW